MPATAYPNSNVFTFQISTKNPPQRQSPVASPNGASRSMHDPVRRANHNAIERARRESLNIRFQELAQGIPSLNSVRKPSKAVIVARAIDHVVESNARIEVKSRALATIRERNQELLMEVNRLRDILGLPLESEEILVDEDMLHEASLAAAAATQASRQSFAHASASTDNYFINGDMSGLATPTSAMSSPVTNGELHMGRQGGPGSPDGMMDDLEDEEQDSFRLQQYHQQQQYQKQQQQHHQQQATQNASFMPPNALKTPPAESPGVEDVNMGSSRQQAQSFHGEVYAQTDRFNAFDDESLTQLLHSTSVPTTQQNHFQQHHQQHLQQPMPVPIPSPGRRPSHAYHPAAHQYHSHQQDPVAGVSLSSSLHSFSTASQSFHQPFGSLTAATPTTASSSGAAHHQHQSHSHHTGSAAGVMPSPATSMIGQPDRMGSLGSLTLEDELLKARKTPIPLVSSPSPSGAPGLIHQRLQRERRGAGLVVVGDGDGGEAFAGDEHGVAEEGGGWVERTVRSRKSTPELGGVASRREHGAGRALYVGGTPMAITGSTDRSPEKSRAAMGGVTRGVVAGTLQK
ncbi:hypothetical protein HK101_003819 [Irineochytrium annulatum]|nr:hypothetical protein HK101_003819 [Irineochytrium annulatum]